MGKTRLMFVADNMNIGGTENALVNLLREMAKNDSYEIELVLLQNTAFPHTLPESINVVRVPIKSELALLPVRNAIKPCIEQREYALLLKKLFFAVNWRICNMNISFFAADIFDGIVKRSADVCIVYTDSGITLLYSLLAVDCQSIFCFFHNVAQVGKNAADSLYYNERIRRMITVSQGNASLLSEKFPRLKEKITLLHNVVDEEHVCLAAQEKTELPKEEGVPALVSVCRIMPERGVLDAIAVAAILKERGIRFTWRIIGPFSNEQYKIQCLSALKENKLEEHMCFLGGRSNPLPYVAQADLFVNTSHIESYGMATKEAQILGIPVIATNTPGSLELIHDGVTGFITPIGDAAKMAEAIERLIGDPESREMVKRELLRKRSNEKAEIIKRFNAMVAAEGSRHGKLAHR